MSTEKDNFLLKKPLGEILSDPRCLEKLLFGAPIKKHHAVSLITPWFIGYITLYNVYSKSSKLCVGQ